ncbi:MAG: truB [Candidatus Midichloriaceae bacterium]|jgi:tRNA pseudouridine55 synthase|nr:truB [Candidatus Midichloriaceae bacterium]
MKDFMRGKIIKESASSQIPNKPLRKLASGSEVQGVYGTEDRSVLNIHEDLSTGATQQLAAEVEFQKGFSGWIILDKPLSISSATALNKIKRTLLLPKSCKIGHAGTLDPMASGVLVVALGEATKAIKFAMSSCKSYNFTITWGENRDTIDVEGSVTERNDKRPALNDIKAMLAEFVPTYMQTPPQYSAVKVAGKRAYDLARSGKEFELQPKPVSLTKAEVIEHNKDSTTISIDCGKGFYVRSLAFDLASKLGVLGYVSHLRRTRIGKFTESDAISLESLEKLMHNDSTCNWNNLIMPITAVLDDILVQQVSELDASRLKFGQKIRINSEDTSEEVVAVCENIPVAICSLEAGVLIPRRIFNL